VVYIPVTDELFFATYQNGAFQRIENEDVILQASKFSIQDSGLTIVCTRSHLNDLTQQFITQFKCPNVVPVGSSIKYIKLAKGEAHIYPCLYPTMEWDTAAAQIILEEAGGKVIDFSTQMPLTYNKHNLKNHGQIALAKEQ
ncbi:MAG: inositol monophosphatase family protein, partial [Saprospiraceae bacterium]